MANVFNLSLPQLRQWSRHQLADHRQLNEPVEAINRMTTGVGLPRQVAAPPMISQGIVVAAFQYYSMANDHIVCKPWDDLDAESVLIAKPYLLRRSPFDGQTHGGIHYVYNSATSRTATLGEETESQIVIPRFVYGDMIVASSPILRGTDVVDDDAPIIWLDDNRDGRAWAAEYEEE